MKTVKDLVSNNGCSIPWLHVDVNLQNNIVRPCCKYTDVVGTPGDFKQAWHSEQYQQLRNDQINNNPHKQCQACDVAESAFSYKKFKNIAYKNLMPATQLEPAALPQVFNITLKNTCNLACRMCFPGSSSKLKEVSRRSEFLTRMWPDRAINNRFDISSLRGNFTNVRQLTITGGEPLIDRDCLKLIQMVKEEASYIERIVFSTNMTMFHQDIIDALVEAKLPVVFNVSIDGPAKIHEYIRYGCKWEDIINNLRYLRQNYNFIFGINSTISALNVGYLPELVNDVEELGRITNIKFTHLMATPVLEDHLHAGSLPAGVKQQYLNKLNAYAIRSAMPGVPELVNAGKELLAENGNPELFNQFTKEFDIVANTKLTDVYPELG